MTPFFMPAGILDNMPNFQRGIMAALGRFSTESTTSSASNCGSSQTDRDLEQLAASERAAQHLAVRASRCRRRRRRTNTVPAVTSCGYTSGWRQDRRFERRADNQNICLMIMVHPRWIRNYSRIIEKAGDLFDARCDDIFYFNKGRLYANFRRPRARERTSRRSSGRRGDQRLEKCTVEGTFRIAAARGSRDRLERASTAAHVQGSPRSFYLLRAAHATARDQ